MISRFMNKKSKSEASNYDYFMLSVLKFNHVKPSPVGEGLEFVHEIKPKLS